MLVRQRRYGYRWTVLQLIKKAGKLILNRSEGLYNLLGYNLQGLTKTFTEYFRYYNEERIKETKRPDNEKNIDLNL